MLAMVLCVVSWHVVAAFTVAFFETRDLKAFHVGYHRDTVAESSLVSTRTLCIASNADSVDNSNKSNETGKNKRIVLIRHGCTHMNEYLSVPGTRWGDANFTDVFDEETERYRLFRDSPLSPRGVSQAKRLSAKLGHLLEGRPGADIDSSLGPEDQNIINEIELIACSPLSRALQTVELALLPHIEPLKTLSQDTIASSSSLEDISDEQFLPHAKRRVPIVALPLAGERVYLISDFGRSAKELSERFPFCDFKSEIDPTKEGSWWFTMKENDEEYVEWRPSGEGQRYACHGEPEEDFNQRMTDLYDWLAARPESTIGLVCHWGVIDWLIGEDFENCEMRVVNFDSMQRTGFMLSDAEAAEIFSQGERSVIKDTD